MGLLGCIFKTFLPLVLYFIPFQTAFSPGHKSNDYDRIQWQLEGPACTHFSSYDPQNSRQDFSHALSGWFVTSLVKIRMSDYQFPKYVLQNGVLNLSATKASVESKGRGEMKRKPVYIVFPPWIYSSSRITKRFKDLRLLGVYAPALSSPHSRFRGGKKKNFLSLNPPWIYELYITFCLLVSQQIRVPKVKKKLSNQKFYFYKWDESNRCYLL